MSYLYKLIHLVLISRIDIGDLLRYDFQDILEQLKWSLGVLVFVKDDHKNILYRASDKI